MTPPTSAPPGSPRGFPPAAPSRVPPVVLEPAQWRERERRHRERVQAWTRPHRERAARGEAHPVYDFLWTYYSLRPALLERWHPGIGVGLRGAEAREFRHLPGYGTAEDGSITAAPATLSPRRREAIRWITALLRACATRAPHFGCFGLHEWAMLHRSPAVRHAATPLRCSADVIARVVEEQPLRCTHFDAFRFFTPEARPRNRTPLTAETRLAFEQRGCIHVTMDLYKWAYKLAPFSPAELVADAFSLALAARELDMRASPYDLRELGFAPVPVETAAGRAVYEREQRELAQRAEPVRERLLAVGAAVLAELDA